MCCASKYRSVIAQLHCYGRGYELIWDYFSKDRLSSRGDQPYQVPGAIRSPKFQVSMEVSHSAPIAPFSAISFLLRQFQPFRPCFSYSNHSIPVAPILFIPSLSSQFQPFRFCNAHSSHSAPVAPIPSLQDLGAAILVPRSRNPAIKR